MADTPTSALLNNRRRRAMIACTNCRRRKIKCVTTEEPPQRPCARCTKRGLGCEYVAVDEPTTPESPSRPLASPSYNAPGYYGSPGVSSPGYMPPYASPPSQPQYPGSWNPPPQSQPVYGYPGPGPSPSYNASYASQNLYGGSQGYPAQYSMPQQFATPTPTNQWPQGLQGSMPQQPKQALSCARKHLLTFFFRCVCNTRTCYCGARS
ncbi:hypothetical protein K438DRAFT_27901 [Mycena galopus ATCC 62051]|nr:hypothetical protein K438DRAFT_27901 [Mycena galopus ATCC 62051]